MQRRAGSLSGFFGVEMVGKAHIAQGTDRTAQVHVIAGDQKAAAAPPEAVYGRAVLRRQAIAGVHREQPHLVDIALVDA